MYSTIWLTCIKRSLSFPWLFHADRVIMGVTLQSRSTFQNLEGTMWLAKIGKGMLFSNGSAGICGKGRNTCFPKNACMGGYPNGFLVPIAGFPPTVSTNKRGTKFLFQWKELDGKAQTWRFQIISLIFMTCPGKMQNMTTQHTSNTSNKELCSLNRDAGHHGKP